MTEHEIIRILRHELRDLPRDRQTEDALRRAALRISREAEAERQRAARAASAVGFAVTRGKVRI